MADKQPKQSTDDGQSDVTHIDLQINLEAPDSANVSTLLDAAAGAVAQTTLRQTHMILSDGSVVGERTRVEATGTEVNARLTSTFEPDALRFWGLPKANLNFIGREAELDTLTTQLEQTGNVGILGKSQAHVGQSVSGLGGVGKTQLALAFARRHQRKQSERAGASAAPSPTAIVDDKAHYDAILWLRAGNLSTETMQLAKACGVDTEVFKDEALCKEICRRLTRLGQRILLVFDDVDAEDALANWSNGIGALRDGHHGNTVFHLLATSRSEHWQDWACVALDVFTEAEAIAFVQARLAGTTPEIAGQLTSLVHRFPLALEQAVAYILAQNITIDDYRTQYQAQQRALLSETQGMQTGLPLKRFFQDRRQQAAYHTWYLSVNKLREDCPLAETVLNLCAFLASDSIPCWLMTNEQRQDGLLDLDPVEAWYPALNQLRQYSLVTFHGETDVANTNQPFERLDMHQLVQEVVRLHLKQQAITDEKAQGHLAGLPFPDATTSSSSGAKTVANTQPDCCYDRYGRHVLERLVDLFDYDFAQPQTWKLAAMLLPHGKQIAKLADRKENPWGGHKTGYLWGTLGTYQYQVDGDAEEAQICQEHALKIFKHLYGPEHLEVAITASNLGNAYGSLGQYNPAKHLIGESLAIKVKHYGPSNAEVIKTYNDLAAINFALGYFDEAQEQFQKVLTFEESHYGPNDRQLFIVLMNLVVVHRKLGNYERQKQLLERAFSIAETNYHNEHPYIAGCYQNLGLTASDVRDHVAAKSYFEKSLAIYKKCYGEKNVKVAEVLSDMAPAQEGLGNYRELKRQLEEALSTLESYYGPEHVRVAMVLNGLGQAHNLLRDYTTARHHLERALRLKEIFYGPDNPDNPELASTLYNLATAHGGLGNYQAQRDLLERTLKLDIVRYGTEHIRVAETQDDLADAHVILGEMDKAEECLRSALRIKTAWYGPSHAQVSGTQSKAQMIQNMRQMSSMVGGGTAVPIVAIPMHGAMPHQIPQSPAIGAGVNTGTTTESILGTLIAALNAHQRQSPQTADTMRDLARAYQLKGDNTQAIACFKQSIATQPHPLTYVDLGYCLLRQQQPARALKYVSKVLALSLAKRQAHRVRYGWREVNTLFDDSLKACANSEGEVRLSITDWANYVAIQCHRALSQYPQAQQQLATWQSTATTSKAGTQLWQACQAEFGPQTAASLADTTKPTTPPMRFSQSKDTLFGHPETKTEPSPTEPASQASHPMTHQSQLSDKAPSLAPA